MFELCFEFKNIGWAGKKLVY